MGPGTLGENNKVLSTKLSLQFSSSLLFESWIAPAWAARQVHPCMICNSDRIFSAPGSKKDCCKVKQREQALCCLYMCMSLSSDLAQKGCCGQCNVILCGCRDRQLEHALLLYFASHFQKAHKGMQQYMRTPSEGQSEQDLLNTAFARVSYLLHEEEGWTQRPSD